MRTSEPSKASRYVSVAACFLVYAALLGISAWKHIIWLDEAQAWLIARDSPTVLSVLHNVRYEGHPPLWHYVLWVITRFTANIEWIKLPNMLFSLAAAWLILTAEKVPLWMRLGFVFSYYMVFEYSVINRNYMLGIALLVAAARLLNNSRYSRWTPILLLFAALSSLPALVVAAGLYGLYLQPTLRNLRTEAFSWKRLAVLVLFAVCTVGMLAIIRPPEDSKVVLLDRGVNDATKYLSGIQISLRYVTEAFDPAPRALPTFWNTYAVDRHTSALSLALRGIALLVALTFFFRTRMIKTFFLAESLVLIAEIFISGRSHPRHVGWLFVVFMLGVMIEYDRRPAVVGWESFPWRKALLAGIFTLQIIAASIALRMSWQYPFSHAREMAAYMRSQHLENAPVVLSIFEGAALLAYLQRPSAYDLVHHHKASFTVWDRRVDDENIVPTPQDIAAAYIPGQPVLFLSILKLSPEQEKGLQMEPLAEFIQPTGRREQDYLYRWTGDDPPSSTEHRTPAD